MASLVKNRICSSPIYKWVVVVEIESHAAGLFCFWDFVLQLEKEMYVALSFKNVQHK